MRSLLQIFVLASWTVLPAFSLAAASFAAASPAREDLSKVYPSTRTWSQTGLFPVCTEDDVWEIKSFEIAKGKDLVIRGKKATVAFGHDGTDVLWAVILPDQPWIVEGSQVPEDETIQSIVLRFSPAELGRIFPSKTVSGRGQAWRRYQAYRIASQKMVWKWCTPAGNPTIVPAGCTIVDVDTVEGPRRMWLIDRNSGTLQSVPGYEGKATPRGKPIESRKAKQQLQDVWEQFDRTYAGFVGLPKLNWKKEHKTAEKLLKHVDTTHDLGAVISQMVSSLEDLHVWVRVDGEWLPGYQRDRPLNGNYEATIAALAKTTRAGDNLVWGRTEDNIGYLGVHGLNDENLGTQVDAALEGLKDTRGMIVDLRFNGGGSELLGRDVAGRFLDEPTVYGWNRYRNGSKHDALGPVLERQLEPRGPWRYDKPVVCLMGRKTMSSAESLAMMFAKCPDATTMGSATAGSSANPRTIELDTAIVVNMPTWLDMLEDGSPLERRGFTPSVLVEHEAEAFKGKSDPVMVAALARLRR